MQLANQQQLPQVDPTRKKPKTGNENQYLKAIQQQQQLFQSNPQAMHQNQLVFQGDQMQTQKPYSPTNVGNGDLHYMYFTPREVINL